MTDTAKPTAARFWKLALGSIGVVFGDIGTSPLYAFKESIHHMAPDGVVLREDVLGVISLMIWTLIVIVLLKYVLLLMRLDNRGEGGTLALMALVQQAIGRRTKLLLFMAMASAGLFFGDALLTPAVSVLSAVEGLEVIPGIEHTIEPLILPIALVILVALFLVQRWGTEIVGAWFGPICLVWFVVLGGLGLLHVMDDPGIFSAVSPHHAVSFLTRHTMLGFIVLGSVFLTVTGAEALYADMGHFGRRPISAMWIWLVLPCLVLNYLGQGALVLSNPDTLDNPFFHMAPDWAQWPLVILATMATVIASQAVISGAFSLAQQAIQLGLLPRLRIVNTSGDHAGQIYMPQINYILLFGVVVLVLAFQSSSAMASAYGLSVIGAMITSTFLAFLAIQRVWKKGVAVAFAITAPFLIVEFVFLGANLLKLAQGGYVPLLIAAAIIIVLWTWLRGTGFLMARTRQTLTLKELFEMLARDPPHRVKGTAIFMTGNPDAAPVALLHNLKHNKVLHEQNIILKVRAAQQPRVPDNEKIEIREIADGAKLIIMTFGFMETPNVSYGLSLCKAKSLNFEIMSTSFFISHYTLLAERKIGMPLWQDHLFIFLYRNATHVTDFFRIPSSRVIEIGAQMSI